MMVRTCMTSSDIYMTKYENWCVISSSHQPNREREKIGNSLAFDIGANKLNRRRYIFRYPTYIFSGFVTYACMQSPNRIHAEDQTGQMLRWMALILSLGFFGPNVSKATTLVTWPARVIRATSFSCMHVRLTLRERYIFSMHACLPH
jgi:hypothetical protein